MTTQEIEYSDKYFDDEFEYRCTCNSQTSSLPKAFTIHPWMHMGYVLKLAHRHTYEQPKTKGRVNAHE
eukprot:6173488-Pleurochrysis_carterae.AAC.4